MNEEEKKAVCELKNYITKRKRSYTKLDRHDKAINNLLNLIGNLQKENEQLRTEVNRLKEENEELKQDRNNNYQMIALAQNETLGYMQGYEDGKKLKRSAIASIVENQQYYIIKKQMEKYEEHIAKLQKENEQLRTEVNSLKEENEELKGQYAEYVKLTCNVVAKNSESNSAKNSESNSAIKEKDEIINKQKELIEYLRRSCDRKESCWIEEQHENVELETKLEEKDKTINAMAEYIASRDIDEDICKYINCGEGDKEREECIECVIDFFQEF